jgi:hypothetical protein
MGLPTQLQKRNPVIEMTAIQAVHKELPDNDVPATTAPSSTWLACLATLASLAAYVWYSNHGEVLAYKDALSHMELARRVVDSPTSGFPQLGGVWLPLPHILMLPFIWFNPFYYSGFAGSIVSMASYVVCSVLLFKIVWSLTENRLAAVVGALVFMANPNVLYMQSTPMTELLLFACLLAAVYFMIRWIQTDDYRFLPATGVSCFLGSWTRYEAWMQFVALLVVVAVVLWRRYGASVKLQGVLIAFLLFGIPGPVLWAVWNLLLFGNPLYFQNGEYAKPSLWVGSSDVAVHNLGVAARTYWYAMTDDLGIVVVGLMLLGYGCLLIGKRRDWLATLPVLALLVCVPFFVGALYAGERPLHVMQINGDLYNVRFGLLMVLPAAIAIGYLMHTVTLLGNRLHHGWRSFGYGVAVGGLGLFVGWSLISSVPATLQEPRGFRSSTTDSDQQASDFLRTHYKSGTVLAAFFGNESILFNARIDLGHNIYEGSYKLWQPALHDPRANHINWIVMRRSSDNPDPVFAALHGTVRLDPYRQVFADETYLVYRRR